MADQQQGDGGEDECVNAFKSGNKHLAEQLLPHTRPADVRTRFRLVDRFNSSNVDGISASPSCLLGVD